jgi:hypothetical protein
MATRPPTSSIDIMAVLIGGILFMLSFRTFNGTVAAGQCVVYIW